MTAPLTLKRSRFYWPFVLWSLTSACQAAPEIAPVFGPDAVLPRDHALTIFGRNASAGETVTVTMGGKIARGVASPDGRWKVALPALPAGGPHELSVEAPSGKSVSGGILIGDLWLCSGQSNMAFAVKESAEAAVVLAAPADEQLRFFNIPQARRPKPQADLIKPPTWKSSTPDTVSGAYAIAWHFGQKLREEAGVPVGLIMVAWGGTQAQCWTPREALTELNPNLVTTYDAWLAGLHLGADGLPSLPDPKIQPPPPFGHSNTPMDVFNALIHPLTPASLTGVLWYQGEQDAGSGLQYQERLETLIRGWRTAFTQPELPFLIVQLPGFGGKFCEGFPSVRTAQALAAKSVPHTALVVTLDTGEKDNIHPKAKAEVGQRAALAALGFVHGHSVAWKSPEAKIATRRPDDAVLLELETFGQKLTSLDGKPLRAFELAGDDGKFIAAEAILDANDSSLIRLRTAERTYPRKVRYAAAPFPEANLGTTDQLAVGPFEMAVGSPP